MIANTKLFGLPKILQKVAVEIFVRIIFINKEALVKYFIGGAKGLNIPR